MSTCVFEKPLRKEIYTKQKLLHGMIQQLSMVNDQVSSDKDSIFIDICGIEIELNYKDDEISIIS